MVVLILSLVTAAAYFYYWFGMERPQKLEIIEPELSFEPWEPEEIAPFQSYEEDVTEEDLIVAQISSRPPINLYVENLPDVKNIPHVSAILKLQRNEIPVSQNSDTESEDAVKIAIVIDDMGASPARTKEIMNLKAPLTSSFVTFAPQLKKQVEQARQAGHELMIHVPMQPKSNIFVSDDVLKVNMTQEDIEKRFSAMLDKFDHVVGVNNHMGSYFTEYGDKLEPVMKLLAQHHLFVLDSRTTPLSQIEKVASQYHVPSVHRHIFLDNEDNPEYILRQLERTENIAYKNGYAIAIGHPKKYTAHALETWLKTLPQKKVKLVHLSQIVKTVSDQY